MPLRRRLRFVRCRSAQIQHQTFERLAFIRAIECGLGPKAHLEGGAQRLDLSLGGAGGVVKRLRVVAATCFIAVDRPTAISAPSIDVRVTPAGTLQALVRRTRRDSPVIAIPFFQLRVSRIEAVPTGGRHFGSREGPGLAVSVIARIAR
jgi:hypothetical protein